MSHNLEIVVDLREGALVRTLGLIERRGFFPLGVQTTPGQQAGTLRVAVCVCARETTRSIQVLQRQLRRLYDVREVLLAAESLPEVRTPEPVPC